MNSKIIASFVYVVAVVVVLFACDNRRHERSGKTEPVSLPDLPDLQAKGTLTVLTENTSASFYLFRGQAMGYDYELLKAFAKEHDLNLEVKLLSDLNSMFDRLNSGEGDIIACNLTASADRLDRVSFTHPLNETRQVLVQRKPKGYRSMSKAQLADSLIQSWSQLSGREVYVHQFSTFHKQLVDRTLAERNGPNIIQASGSITSEQLIRLVAEGQIDHTIADENMALLNASYYPNLDVSFALSDPEPIAWAVRKDADSLRIALDAWITDKATERKRKFLYNKYFLETKDQVARVKSAYSSLEGGKISDYDDAIRKFSAELRWDWRLLAAMIYQESRFNPEARSWAGAFGLMQMMPATAERFGIDTTHTRETNIKAGVAYLKYLDRFWRKTIVNDDERVNFVLASYNIGPGHIEDARVIAKHIGKDPNVWANNVADGLLLKHEDAYGDIPGIRHGYCRCTEPVNYVRNVVSKYQEYQSIE